jgi:branched-chain amino acid transport system substrate-binding protein
METAPPLRTALLLLAAVFVAVLLAGGCAQVGQQTQRPPDLPEEYADTLYTQLKSEFEVGDFMAAEKTARRLADDYPSFDRVDEVLTIGARSSVLANDYVQAVKYALVVVDDHSLSPYREEALFIAAESYHQLGKPYQSATMLLQLLSSPVDAEMEGRALSALRILSQEQLGISDLERLVKEYPSSPLAGEMSLALAKREFARGNYDGAYTLLADLLYQFPQHRRAPEVRQLLKLSADRRANPDTRLEYVEPNKFGVVLPLTGNFSRYGRYFEQGVTLAVEEFNASSEVAVAYVTGDSRGNPIDAVRAVRRLVVEEGVVAVLGSVLAVPSVAAAVECNAWRVPLLSPVPTRESIDEIGSWVFQTKVSSEIEVSAMARVAREDLLIERFAVLAPATSEKQELAEYFAREIGSRGGVIVASESYQEGASDFREQLEVIREAAPEALFVPGEPEELILMLPQISFYDLRVQLLGLSNWNSEKLLRLSQQELEGAIFPGEALHGKDRETHQRFVSDYRQQYGNEIHPVATAAYFGMRLLLQSIGAGAVDRTQVRDYLDQVLNASAEQRMAEANSLSILNVRSGKVREFTTSSRKP